MLSKRIAYLRKKNDMSQAQLANKIGISPSTLGMYEQGRREPSLDVLISLSRAFRVSLDYLATGAEYTQIAKRPDSNRFIDYPCTTCFWKEYKENQSL